MLAQHIEEDPDAPGPGDARLVESGVPVWALVGYLPAVDGQAKQVAAAFALPEAVVAAALAYYARHKCAIDARLAANTAPAA